jgi:hypothetical protein
MIQVLDATNRILGVKHPDTIRAMENLAATYQHLGKYMEAEMLEMQVLDARNRILGLEHPDMIHAMGNLPSTYYEHGKYTDAEKLVIQAQEVKSRVPEAESPYTIATVANVQEALETQFLNRRSTVSEEENLHSIQIVSNPPVEAVLPDTIINPETNGMYFSNCCLNPL